MSDSVPESPHLPGSFRNLCLYHRLGELLGVRSFIFLRCSLELQVNHRVSYQVSHRRFRRFEGVVSEPKTENRDGADAIKLAALGAVPCSTAMRKFSIRAANGSSKYSFDITEANLDGREE